VTLDKHAAKAWETGLAKAAEGRNLAEPQDRALFSTEVGRMTSRVVLAHVRDLAAHFGAVDVPHTRLAVTRALADAYIAKVTRR
jgi:hypothetical protein